VQRATAQSKTGIFRDYGVAEAPPGFQAGWSDCMYLFFSLSVHFVCSSRVSVYFFVLPYQSLTQMTCREEVGVSFVVHGV
jgi:hypothetical protein